MGFIGMGQKSGVISISAQAGMIPVLPPRTAAGTVQALFRGIAMAVFKRTASVAAIVSASTVLAACSSWSIPFTHREPAAPDLAPASHLADNMVRLDASMRSGCDSVQNIEKPSDAAPTPGKPQRWIARTCTGDISYDIVATQTEHGPVVKVLPVKGPLNKPINPSFKPALPEDD
ncbi:unnamed protein product [Mycetohabitans rhizoxinica HKI 454]|uniref:Uncharacterized protein n=2 Tax=Burkholderiaceae TaxID=119060 RepID=E5AQL5_MYCRK|nr:unnamed protein product [Mycetohabitans rhizoxinica HKI 454]